MIPSVKFSLCIALMVGANGPRVQAESEGLSQWQVRVDGSTELGRIPLNAVAYGAGRFVAAANGGWVMTSTDGADWEASQWGERNFANVVFGEGWHVVAAYDGHVLVLIDGETPVEASAGMPVRALAYGNGRFVALFEGLDAPPAPGGAGVSADGVVWENRSLPMFVQPFSPIYKLFFGGGKFVVVSFEQVFVSEDGFDWASRLEGDRRFRSGAYGNGVFVLTGRRPAGPEPSPAFVLISVDGEVWEEHALSFALDRVHFGGGLFLGLDAQGRLFSSGDGVHWRGHEAAPALAPAGMAYGGSAWVAVGNVPRLFPPEPSQNGLILQSGPVLHITALRLNGNGAPSLRIGAAAGASLEVEASFDLRHWEAVGVLPEGALEWTAPNRNEPPQQFFRLVMPSFRE